MASRIAGAPFLLNSLRLCVCCVASVSSQMPQQWPKQASPAKTGRPGPGRKGLKLL